jgi:hypothetical protein
MSPDGVRTMPELYTRVVVDRWRQQPATAPTNLRVVNGHGLW